LITPAQVDATNRAIVPQEAPAAALETAPVPAATNAATTRSAAPPSDKRAENAEQLRLAQRMLEVDAANTAAAQQVAHYQSILAALAQQDVVDQQIKDLHSRKAELEKQLNAPATAESQQGVHSFVELDRLKDELAAELARASLVDDRLSAARSALEKAQRAEDECAVKRRQAQEAFEVGKDGPNAAELAAAAEQARQAATLAAETVALRKRELEREKLLQEVQRLAVRICQEQVARLSPLVAFSQTDLEEQISQIKKKEESAYRSLARAQSGLHDVNLQVQETQKQLEAETGDRSVLAEKLEAHRRQREKRTDEIDSLTQRLGRFAQLRLAWNRRYEIAAAKLVHRQPEPDGQPAWAELKDWQEETQSVLDELAAELRTQIFFIRTLRSSLTSLTKKVDAAKETAGKEGQAQEAAKNMLPWIELQRSQVEAMLRIHESNMVTIETSRRVHEKLLEELGRGVLALTPKNLALSAWDQVVWIWQFELAHIDDRPINIGKIVHCLAVFIVGWFLARLLAGLVANRLLKRFRLSKDATAAIRSLAFYVLMAVVTLAALRTVRMPLTAFTMLGGALAIGVGFGSQALVNNFVGGLIMLAERPVRLGERIIFGDFDGVVEEVGFRCTKLRSASDHLITIPNSTLVNDSIENAARRRTIRRQWNLALACDTPRMRVAAAVQVVRDILTEKDIRERIHPIVGFEELSPRVYFSEVRPDSLVIQVVYWYAPPDSWDYMEHAERVNLRIMEEFERLGVQFAIPAHPHYIASTASHRDLAA
jgi:small-conductance mechanosensitive channel